MISPDAFDFRIQLVFHHSLIFPILIDKISYKTRSRSNKKKVESGSDMLTRREGEDIFCLMKK